MAGVYHMGPDLAVARAALVVLADDAASADDRADATEALTRLVATYGEAVLDAASRHQGFAAAGTHSRAARVGPTPDHGYQLYSAAQPGEPQGSQILVGEGGADVGYAHIRPHSHPGGDVPHSHDIGGPIDPAATADGQAFYASNRPRGTVSSSGRQGTTPPERAHYLAAIDQPSLNGTYGYDADQGDEADPFPELGRAERALELAEQDWNEARATLGEARSRCIPDGTVGYVEGGDGAGLAGADDDGLINPEAGGNRPR